MELELKTNSALGSPPRFTAIDPLAVLDQIRSACDEGISVHARVLGRQMNSAIKVSKSRNQKHGYAPADQYEQR